MSKTAYLRPLITNNFIFDFPSQFKTKELQTFTEGDFQQIAQHANENMQKIMHGDSVLWYIQKKNSAQIIGWVKFEFQNSEQTVANLTCELAELSESELAEIGQRIVHICTDNLQLTEITISSNLNAIICQQLKNHYNMNNNKLLKR